MSAKEAKHRTYQESDGIDHATGAIAFRLWRATLYPVEITSGQNFGEEQWSSTLKARDSNPVSREESGFREEAGILPSHS